jgi:hypothetical protein
VADYVSSVVSVCDAHDVRLSSVIVFGSSVTGGYISTISDVDMFLVLTDGADPDAAERIRPSVEAVEEQHGFRKPLPAHEGALASLARRLSANVRSFFICSRADLISGDPVRILGIPRSQALFVDRVVVPSLVGSARTVWGEDLLPHVPLLPIRRLDVFKAWFGQFAQLLLNAALYPVVPQATGYAMDALKRSIHNCYYCYTLRPAPLASEVAFFQSRRRLPVLDELLLRRGGSARSLRFILRCLPALTVLHIRTALDNEFPRRPGAGMGTGTIVAPPPS